MGFKTLLTVTTPGSGDADLKMATALAGEVEAHLAVLVIALANSPRIGRYSTSMADDWLRERRMDEEKLRERSAAVSEFLASRTASSDVSSEYAEDTWVGEVVGQRARYADLVIVGPEMLKHEALKEKVIEGTLFSSGRPLLLAPDGSTPTLKPRRIAVAWDSSIEASSAVGRSLHLLKAADEVRLAMVDPVDSELGQDMEPGADIAAYLARHGVTVTVDRLPSQGRGVVATLRQHAIDNAAELLVMGAYGHSRIRERIFGGVTRSMIDQPPLPILMAR